MDLVGITTEGDKVKLVVSGLAKGALTQWRQYVSQYNNALANLDWKTLKYEIGSAFEDIYKDLRFSKRLKKLSQTRSVNGKTKVLRTILLELGDREPNENALVFTYINGVKDDVQIQVLLQRPNLPSEAEQLAQRADAHCLEGSKGGKATNSQTSNGSSQGGMKQ